MTGSNYNGELISPINQFQTILGDEASNKRPMRLIYGYKMDGFPVSELPDLSVLGANRISVCLLSTKNDGVPAVGFTLGLLANLQVQRNIGRVKNGSLPLDQAYLTNGDTVEKHRDDFDLLHSRAYLFPRSYVGKSGYFFADDPTCAPNSDDYSSIARGRVIDKADRIAYATFVEEILDEVEVSTEGKLDPAQAKYYQSIIQGAIESNMSANEEISGVSVFVDQDQNVLMSDMVKINIRIQPKGYAKYIKISLGYTLSANSGDEGDIR